VVVVASVCVGRVFESLETLLEHVNHSSLTDGELFGKFSRLLELTVRVRELLDLGLQQKALNLHSQSSIMIKEFNDRLRARSQVRVEYARVGKQTLHILVEEFATFFDGSFVHRRHGEHLLGWEFR